MKYFFDTVISILVLLNPFAVLSAFLCLTEQMTERERREVCRKSLMAIIVSGILLLFCGQYMFQLLGIDIYLFKAGGGVVLMICSIRLVWGDNIPGKPRQETPDTPAGIAVVPVAIPMAVGPGTAAGIIVIGLERGGAADSLIHTGALITAAVLLEVLLFLGHKTEQILKKSGIQIVTKLSGLFLSAIAAKMILDGVKGYL